MFPRFLDRNFLFQKIYLILLIFTLIMSFTIEFSLDFSYPRLCFAEDFDSVFDKDLRMFLTKLYETFFEVFEYFKF